MKQEQSCNSIPNLKSYILPFYSFFKICNSKIHIYTEDGLYKHVSCHPGSDDVLRICFEEGFEYIIVLVIYVETLQFEMEKLDTIVVNMRFNVCYIWMKC